MRDGLPVVRGGVFSSLPDHLVGWAGRRSASAHRSYQGLVGGLKPTLLRLTQHPSGPTAGATRRTLSRVAV